jgi:hypothetical protein
MTSADNSIEPDSFLFGQVSAALFTPGDVTYLAIGEAPSMEIVRVTGYTPGFLLVTRGVDGTTARAFPAGTPVRYIMPAQAVLDMIQDAIAVLPLPSNLTFSINAPNAVQQMGNNVDIVIAPTSVTSPDGSVDVTGGGFAVGVAVARGAFGCCD